MTNSSNENSRQEPVKSLNHVLFTLDAQENISSIGPGCSEVLGFLPNEMIGRTLSVFILPEERDRAREMGDLIKQGKTDSFTFHIAGKDGGLLLAMVVSRTVFNGQENAGMIGVIGEISGGKSIEKILWQTNARIHLLNSIVRHDINNQLTVLNGYLSLMDQGDDTFNSPEIVRILLGATEKIHKLVTFTSEYKDLGTQLPVWVNLYGVFQSVGSAVETPGVAIVPEPACRDLELFCDPMLTKVFHQLIDNSLRHGKTVSRISLQWELMDGGAKIVYGDNGCGIADSLKSSLFKWQSGIKTRYGMFFVQEILSISGFTITETGTPGNGVRFEIIVPVGSFRKVNPNPQ
ncbi:MAG: PAS domain-containing sensor histidine kinase [Methanomicrobiales archaeon]